MTQNLFLRYKRFLLALLGILALIPLCLSLWFSVLFVKPPAIMVVPYPHAQQEKRVITLDDKGRFDWYRVTFLTHDTPSEVYAFYSQEMKKHDWQEMETDRVLYGQQFAQSDNYGGGNHFVEVKASTSQTGKTSVVLDYFHMTS